MAEIESLFFEVDSEFLSPVRPNIKKSAVDVHYVRGGGGALLAIKTTEKTTVLHAAFQPFWNPLMTSRIGGGAVGGPDI